MKKNAKPQLVSNWWKSNQPKGLPAAPELGRVLGIYEKAASVHKKSKSEDSYQKCANALDFVGKAAAKVQKEASGLIKKPPKKDPPDAEELSYTVEVLKKFPKFVALTRNEHQSNIEEDEGEEDEDGVLNDPAAYTIYLKKSLKKVVRSPLNFALGLNGNRGEDQRMLFHRSKVGKALSATIKRDTLIKKVSWGVATADTTDSGTLVLTLEGKKLPGMAKRTKKMLKAFKPLPFTAVKVMLNGQEIT